MLVDDEYWALKGIESSINWFDLHLEVIASVTSSVQAMSIIMDQQPDIVIIDIMMPDLSGIDIIRYTREQGINCEFIIYSGYSDFEYARKAIKYGVFAYQLKPLDIDEMNKVLTELVRTISKEREQKEQQGLTAFDNISLPFSENFLLAQMPPGKPYCAVVGSCTYLDIIKLKQGLQDVSCSTAKIGSNRYAFLIHMDNNQVSLIINQYQQSSFNNEKVYCFWGISNNYYDKTQYQQAIYEAASALADSFLYNHKSLFFYQSSHVEFNNQLLEQLTLNIHDRSYIQAFFRDYYMNACIEHQLTMRDFCYFYNRLIEYAETYMSQDVQQTNSIEYLSSQEIVDRFENIEDALFYLCELCLELIQPGKLETIENQDQSTFEKILIYVNKHYSEDLYLSDLSDRFFVNMTYICDLFRKHLHTTFSKYLTDLRLNKAEELLRETNLDINHIAEKVGYHDYYYFSKQFKKIKGKNPTDIRQ